MNLRQGIVVLACMASLLPCISVAQSGNNPQWTGVWEGKLDGQPGVTLTLANDTGELGGTLVLNLILNDTGQARVAASEAHVLVHPQLEDSTLSFKIKKSNGSREMVNFTVLLTSTGKMRIHCTDCGSDAPTVDMDKVW